MALQLSLKSCHVLNFTLKLCFSLQWLCKLYFAFCSFCHSTLLREHITFVCFLPVNSGMGHSFLKSNHVRMRTKRGCEHSFMACLWLQRSLGRPLATLTCALRRCQPWFAIVHLCAPWFSADGLEKPSWANPRFSSTYGPSLPWLAVIHFTCFKSSEIRSNMTLWLFLFSNVFSFLTDTLCSPSAMGECPSSCREPK